MIYRIRFGIKYGTNSCRLRQEAVDVQNLSSLFLSKYPLLFVRFQAVQQTYCPPPKFSDPPHPDGPEPSSLSLLGPGLFMPLDAGLLLKASLSLRYLMLSFSTASMTALDGCTVVKEMSRSWRW